MLGTFAAGFYSGIVQFRDSNVLQDPVLIGLTQDGMFLGWAVLEERLDKTDRFGSMLVETFHQGCRMAVSCIFHEWKDTEIGLITPAARLTHAGNNRWINGLVGTLGTAQACALTLTATPNTPAAQNGPVAISFPYLKLRGDSDVGLLFGPEHRVIPFQASVFGYYDGEVPGGATFAVAG